MSPAWILVFAQIAASGWSSGRPRECGDASGHTLNVWERAKSPELRRYCDLIASAASKLAGVAPMVEQALSAAREAGGLLPGYAAPHVLEGRALVALGKYDEAYAAMRAGMSIEPHALDDPQALLAWARTLSRTGKVGSAADAYRGLLPRSNVFTSGERVSAEIEASIVAMSRGAEGIDEAVAALRDAHREARDEARGVVVLVLALALDRRGDAEQARAVLAERSTGDPRELLESKHAKELLAAVPQETYALAAIALEPTDEAGARDQWQQLIDAAPSGVWAAHARAHLRLAGKRGAEAAEAVKR